MTTIINLFESLPAWAFVSVLCLVIAYLARFLLPFHTSPNLLLALAFGFAGFKLTQLIGYNFGICEIYEEARHFRSHINVAGVVLLIASTAFFYLSHASALRGLESLKKLSKVDAKDVKKALHG